MKIADELQSSTLRSSVQYTGTLGVQPRPEKKNGARQLKLSLSLLTSCRLLYINVQGHTFREDGLAERSGTSHFSATYPVPTLVIVRGRPLGCKDTLIRVGLHSNVLLVPLLEWYCSTTYPYADRTVRYMRSWQRPSTLCGGGFCPLQLLSELSAALVLASSSLESRETV